MIKSVYCTLFPILSDMHTNTPQTTLDPTLLNVQLGASPVAALGVVADGVVGAEADPAGNGSVLFGLFTENSLDAEGLDGRLKDG